ncbi:MAG: 23S rRNA (uracil(1939)-C(5))-methyltransferase RlmD [Eubacteriales bacterium]|nr:23S rRNA (uracil(1939)-C(5))-methyltransferase RlmD [Eubacteriales bacterium]
MNKNDEFNITITDMSDTGAGIGKADGFTWFVKDAVIGDHVLAAATKIKKSYGFARLVRVISPSADRIMPPCPEARRCGGCQLQQLDYHAQLHFKEQKVLNDLKRIGGFENAEAYMEPIIGMEEPFRYRNKAVYPIGRNRDGKIIAGFYAGRTHSIIECEDCLLGSDENQRILGIIIGFMEKRGITPYDENDGSGTVRHVLIRKGFGTGELMICLVINKDRLKYSDELCSILRGELPELRSFSLCVNKELTNVIMGTRLINIFGPGYIEDLIYDRPGVCAALSDAKHSTDTVFSYEAGCVLPAEQTREAIPVRFRVSPLSFFQVNSVQMERLYSTALEYAGLTGNENVWDLYCGVGTISLFLARHCAHVYGVEIIPEAIENAKENAALNSITNAEFFTGKAEEVLPEWYSEYFAADAADAADNNRVDVIVVDPPRKGCDPMCLDTMVKIAPDRIVYVSCDPATLARDLRFLCDNGYRIERVRPCDMFPQTVHVETVVLLSHKIQTDKTVSFCR